MNWIELLTFAMAMFVLVVIPGPGVFAVVASALTSGFQKASVVVIGVVLGDILFLFFALFGLNLIADILGPLFLMVKYGGAAYLVYLGFKFFTAQSSTNASDSVIQQTRLSYLSRGLIITLSNPKVILFYMSILPALLDIQNVSGADIVILCLIITLVLGGTMLAYAYAAHSARRVLQESKAQTKLNRVAGSLMILTGGILALRA